MSGDLAAAVARLDADSSRERLFVDAVLVHARVLGRLQHLNIARLHGVSSYMGVPKWLVMERGAAPLSRHIARRGDAGVSVREFLDIVRDVLRGLEFLHDHKPSPICHEDVHEGNVVVFPHPKVKGRWLAALANVGYARFLADISAILVDRDADQPQPPLPPPRYQAPEGRVSPKSDMYSAGVMFARLTLQFVAVPDAPRVDDLSMFGSTMEGGQAMARAAADRLKAQCPQLAKVMLECTRESSGQRPSAAQALAVVTTELYGEVNQGVLALSQDITLTGDTVSDVASALEVASEDADVVASVLAALRRAATVPDNRSTLMRCLHDVLTAMRLHVDSADVAEQGLGFLRNLSASAASSVTSSLMMALDVAVASVRTHVAVTAVVVQGLGFLHALAGGRANRDRLIAVLPLVFDAIAAHTDDVTVVVGGLSLLVCMSAERDSHSDIVGALGATILRVVDAKAPTCTAVAQHGLALLNNLAHVSGNRMSLLLHGAVDVAFRALCLQYADFDVALCGVYFFEYMSREAGAVEQLKYMGVPGVIREVITVHSGRGSVLGGSSRPSTSLSAADDSDIVRFGLLCLKRFRADTTGLPEL